MGSGSTRTLGRRAEQIALQHLLSAGLKSVARNFRRRGGEIDLIMLHGNCLTFIEVRCRSSRRFLHPALSVDRRKQRKIMRTAALFLAEERCFSGYTVRFDVVAIGAGKHDSVEWIQDAFRPDDSVL